MVQGNGFALSDLKVDQISGDTKQAVVWVQFKNFGKDETVIFNLIHDDQGWMIDEIISGSRAQSIDRPVSCVGHEPGDGGCDALLVARRLPPHLRYTFASPALLPSPNIRRQTPISFAEVSEWTIRKAARSPAATRLIAASRAAPRLCIHARRVHSFSLHKRGALSIPRGTGTVRYDRKSKSGNFAVAN